MTRDATRDGGDAARSLDAEGWVLGARRSPSPHAGERPAGCAVSLVVIHGISLPPGEFGGPWIEDFFLGRLDVSRHPYFREISGLRVSPHLLIRRDGTLIQFVPCMRRAWHAGRSSWRGREECNDFSVGIELEGTDTTPYTPQQYACLAPLVCSLRRRYPAIGDEAVVGHSDVAPGRKTDPGPAFDWERLAAGMARGGYNLVRGQTTNSSGETGE